MLKSAIAVAVTALCAGLSTAADRKVVVPKGAQPSANWSHGLQVGDTLYVSGMGGEDAAGKIPATFDAEVRQALANIGAVLKEAGMSPSDVVSVQVYLTDAKLFPGMNAVYVSFFNGPKPTRTTVIVAGLVGDGHIEITATARK